MFSGVQILVIVRMWVVFPVCMCSLRGMMWGHHCHPDWHFWKRTLCHAKSLVPYVSPPFCWWQQLSYVPNVNYWLTGTKASTVTYWKAICQEWWFSNPNLRSFSYEFQNNLITLLFFQKDFLISHSLIFQEQEQQGSHASLDAHLGDCQSAVSRVCQESCF